MPDDAMFAALAAEDAVIAADADAGRTAQRPILTPIIPVPTDAPPCRWRHPKYGDPVAMWPYLNAASRLVGYAARLEYGASGERKKDVYPLTYCHVEETLGLTGLGDPKPCRRPDHSTTCPNCWHSLKHR
jgi:hypothetical protein